ncbi:MAG: protein kinase [Proteobacteria bacterium]|nr:protein kinase [Pseudomonadota bacterium]
MTNTSNTADTGSLQPPEVDFTALSPGQMIGRYEVVAVLGQGGFGITYRARDVQLGREVAIKEYLPYALAMRQDGSTVLPRTTKHAGDFDWGRERFVSEGRTLATLHGSPAIVHVFDFLEANGTAYIIMELLSGPTLEDRLKSVGKLGPEEVDGILWPLLDGLQQVHDAGFLHRDIKPANILLDAAGRPTLIDFGASRAAMAGRTTAMTAIFTPGYAAPEQMTSAKQGPATDIYGLSATLYHAITGKAPASSFDRMLDDTYEPLAQLRPPGFAPGLLAGIDAGLAVAARDRPQSIANWRPLLGLSAAPVADATVVMSQPSPPPTLRHVSTLGTTAPEASTRARGGLWLAIAGIMLAVLAGGGYYAIAMRGPDPEMVKARALTEQAEAARKQAEEEAAKLRAEAEQRQKAEQEAADRKRQEEAQAAERKKLEEETRQKIEAELAAQRQAEEEAKAKAEQEAADRRKAIEAARKAIEFVSGDFDHFGKTLMMIGLKDHPDEIRLQGVDIVDDPALRQLAVNALAAQPRHIKCRQTDRLTDGTPLYRCLITPLNAKAPLADIPDSERSDLALALVRAGLVLASCDAPRAYADAEDEARGRAQSLWGRVKVTEYKRRCSK